MAVAAFLSIMSVYTNNFTVLAKYSYRAGEVGYQRVSVDELTAILGPCRMSLRGQVGASRGCQTSIHPWRDCNFFTAVPLPGLGFMCFEPGVSH